MGKTQKPEKHKCDICFCTYTQKQPSQVLCGKSRCRKHYTRLIAFDMHMASAKGNFQYVDCYICGGTFLKTRTNQPTCTSKICKKEHRRRQVLGSLCKYRDRHRIEIRKRECAYSKILTSTMNPRYLAKLISESVGVSLLHSDIPKEVLETKANILKIKRTIKNERSSTKEQQGTERVPS